MLPPSGGFATVIADSGCKPLYTTHPARAARTFFSRSERKRIERLACREPASIGWYLTHWSHRSLAQAAIDQGYVDRIRHTTVGDILRKAALHPHRFGYWKTTVWDDEAVARALKILWYYGRDHRLRDQGGGDRPVEVEPDRQGVGRGAPEPRGPPGG